jgi:hypothetical protein
MAEKIRIGYKRLFEVRLLHHYWLDFGAANFDSLPDARKTKLLLTYDSRNFIAVNPTLNTAGKLKALRGVFKNTALGFVVAVPEATMIPDDEVFTFELTITDTAFFNYTAMTFISRNIYELYYPVKDKILRFKENVPVFSNLTGVSRIINGEKSLYLSKEIPAPASTDKTEFLNIKGGALVQLTSDQPGGISQQINAAASGMPVFVHQNDTPVLVPPAGLAGTPEKGILLTDEITDSVFAMINITATNPGNPDFSCTSAGIVKVLYPVFQIRFKSRSAFWKYLNKNTGAAVSESSTPLPFTAAGNAGVNKRKPSESTVKVQFESNDPTKRIEKIYTEIFE